MLAEKKDLLFVKVSFCSVQPVVRYSCEISEISFHSLSHPGISSLWAEKKESNTTNYN